MHWTRAVALNLMGTQNHLENFKVTSGGAPHSVSPEWYFYEAGPGPLKGGSIVPPTLGTSAVGSSAQILDIWGQKLPRWPVFSPFPERKVVERNRTRSV